MNVGTLPARHGRYRPTHPALVTETERLTFGDFDRRTARLAAALQAKGIAQGGAIAKRVSGVIILDDFPRSTAGKTLKRVLRAPYWAAHGLHI